MIKRLIAITLILVFSAIPAFAQTSREALEPILTNMLKSIDEGSYEGFIKDLEGEMLQKTTKAEFTQMKDQLGEKLGKRKSLDFLGTIDKNEYIWALWKARFEKLNEEIMIRLVLKKLPDGKFKVSGLWFQ